jgi:Flp pilus assembly protein TadG
MSRQKAEPAPEKAPRRRRNFLTNASGATALEFALVAAPFFFMILCILEMGLVYLVTSSLDNATQEAARQIRTGESQQASYTNATNPTPHTMTATDFRNMVCDNIGWIPTDICQGSLYVDARTFNSFAGQTQPDPLASGALDQGKLMFDMGTAHSIVVVHCYYKWSLITPVLSGALESVKNGGYNVITSSTTFRNEPYST